MEDLNGAGFRPWSDLRDGDFVARLADSIPPLRGFGIVLRACDADALTLAAPLSRNHDVGVGEAGAICAPASIDYALRTTP